MTAQRLRQILLAAGLPASTWQMADATYEPVSSSWVRSNWQAWLDARPIVLCHTTVGVRLRPRWLENASDCDNLALGTMVHGQVGNALAVLTRGAARGGLAYGVLFFVQAKGGGHAINWYVDPAEVLHFFEPGTGNDIDLNTQERASSWFGIAA